MTNCKEAAEYYREKKDAVRKALKDAEPERKTGRWITDGEFINCSACRMERWSRDPYDKLVRRFRYCPNCGAKMEGEQDE